MPAETRKLPAPDYISKAGKLLHSLVPRAQTFCCYDRGRQCIWSSDGADDYEVDAFLSELPDGDLEPIIGDEGMLLRTLPSGRTILALPVLVDNKSCVGLTVALFSKNAGKSSSFNPEMLKNILEPVVEMIGASLKTAEKLTAAERKADEIEKEIDVVYAVDEKIHGASGSHAGLANLVGRSGRFVGINYTVLLIPSKRMRVSATHSSWKKVDRKFLDQYLVAQALPKLEGRRNPVVLEIPAAQGSTDTKPNGHQALLCPILDSNGNVEGVLAQLGKIDDSAFTKSDRRFMAHIGRKVEYVIEQSFDAMTGLMNRPGFESQLRESIATLLSDSDTHQIIYFDLDNLQLINDSFSQEAGDEVIMRFSRLLEEDLPKSAVISRLSGDDFCMLLTRENSDKALEYANAVRDKTSSLRYLEGDKSLQVTISAGIAELNLHCSGVESALMTARMACESAKKHGRDQIVVYEEDNRSVIRRHDDMRLVAKIQQALDSNGFTLVAQPIASLSRATGSSRFEVLLRMKDGDDGAVPTEAFISAAERYRMMPPIDRWVVSTTLSALADAKEFVENENAIFCLNLSGQTIGDDEFLSFIEEEIEQSGVSPSSLCFEITESAAVLNLDKAQAFIDRLKQKGCRIALDDFGAGLSSFAYLKNFNVDILKIDGSFIRDITKNRISESMVAAVTQVAKVMQLETVAEYVQTKAARDKVRKLGVDYAQGHLIGKPAPLESLLHDSQAEELSPTG